MNILNKYWTSTHQKVNEHLERYTQLPPSEKQDVYSKTLAAAAAGGILGACFTSRPMMVASVAGVVTFSYLTQQKNTKKPVSLPTFSNMKNSEPHVHTTFIGIQQLIQQTSIQLNPICSCQINLTRQKNYLALTGLATVPQQGAVNIGPSKVPTDVFKPSSVSNSDLTANEVSHSDNEASQSDNEVSHSDNEASRSDKKTSQFDWEFERNVYEIELHSLMDEIEKLKKELHRNSSNERENELNQKIALLEDKLEEVLQLKKKDRQEFEKSSQQWKAIQKELAETIESQRIQIDALDFQVQQLKKRSASSLKPFDQSLDSNQNTYNELYEDHNKLKKAHTQLRHVHARLTQAFEQKTQQAQQQQNQIQTLQAEVDQLLALKEKLADKLLKVKAKEEKVRENQLREFRQTIENQARMLYKYQLESNNYKQISYYLFSQARAHLDIPNQKLDIIQEYLD